MLEGKKPISRVISVIEYLEKIALLNKMSLSNFIHFLERTPRIESGTNATKRKLYRWENELLEKFDFIGIPLRNKFINDLNSKPPEEIKEILTCLTQIISMPGNKRSALINLVKEMVSHA